LFDAVLSKFGKFPFRCRACTRRFYQYVPAEGEEVEEIDQDDDTTPAETPHGSDSPR